MGAGYGQGGQGDLADVGQLLDGAVVLHQVGLIWYDEVPFLRLFHTLLLGKSNFLLTRQQGRSGRLLQRPVMHVTHGLAHVAFSGYGVGVH